MTTEEYFKNDELLVAIYTSKYAATPTETPLENQLRVAKDFCSVERLYMDKIAQPEYEHLISERGRRIPWLDLKDIYELFKDYKFIIPGGSVLASAGLNLPVSLSNCFVSESPKDDYGSIMDSRKNQVQLMKRRGGVGMDLSNIRPRGAKVNNAARTSTGAASYMGGYSHTTNEVAQEGRRGALMLTLSIVHPDSPEFITAKQDLTRITGANISVKVPDDFIKAVRENKDYILRFPTDLDVTPIVNDKRPFEYNKLYPLQSKEGAYYKIIKAKELWDSLMFCAWNTAEPGIIFEGTMVKDSPDGVYPHFRMVSTNPCGEIGMGENDSCRLIHTNLTSFIVNPFTKDADIAWGTLEDVVYKATMLGDDLVTLELQAIGRIQDVIKDKSGAEWLLWENIKQNTISGRRAGVGFMGLGDMLAMLNLKYDSKEAYEVTHEVMKIIFKVQLEAQADLAIRRGYFPAWDYNMEYSESSNSITYGNNRWFEGLKMDYPESFNIMKLVGKRNISWSSLAPTGTTAQLAQVSSGIEPVFLPFYKRRKKCMVDTDRVDYVDKVGEKYTEYTVVHPMLKQWAIITQNYTEEEVDQWSIGVWKEIWKESPYYGATAPEIDWKRRVQIQGVIQAFTTHSISSTVNLAKETTQEEISELYLEAHAFGLKGITIYRDGCREGILTSLSENAPKLVDRSAPKRPKELEADCVVVKAKGEQFIILVGLLEGKPYEVFTFRPIAPISFRPHKGIITKKGKMHYSFSSDELTIDKLGAENSSEENLATLYSSMLLRHGVDINYIIKTAKKGNDNISSFSSAMCRILAKYTTSEKVKGEVCPDCGGKLAREGGCIHCLDCGYSRCS